MTTAQDLQQKVQAEQKRIQDELTNKVKAILGTDKVGVSSLVALDFNTISLQLTEEQQGEGGVKIIKTFFERKANEKGVERIFACNPITILTVNNAVVGTRTDTAMYNYQLISMLFQTIEDFWKSYQPAEEEVVEESVEEKPTS